MTEDLSAALVDSFDAVFGVHSGVRAAHAKGTSCDAMFTSTPAASGLTSAAHMQGASIPATVRFSNGSGDPGAADSGREPRGMSVKFHLPEGRDTDIVAINQPVFIVRTPQEFLEFMHLRVRDPATGQPDIAGLMAFVAARPESQVAAQILLNAPPIASFFRAPYYAIHAFRWVAADKTERFVRYRWAPSLGEETLSIEDAGARSADYLREDLLVRLSAAPASFSLHVQIASGEDDPADPTTIWPDDRETVHVGDLTVTRPVADQQAVESMIFDPMRMCPGIKPSKDPILAARARAYLVSADRRNATER